jgi:type IV pilus assembly protein PilX
MSRSDHHPPAHGRQRGVMLIVVMLLLLATTLVALASFRGATLEERMAGNTRERQAAFQAAEAALRDAEVMISSDTDGPFRPLRSGAFSTTCAGKLCRSSPAAPLWSGFGEADWAAGNDTKSWAYGEVTDPAGTAALQGVAAPPRYVVEYQGTAQPIEPGKPCVAMFLVTARASGLNTNSNVVLQSVFRLRVGECYASV